VALAPIVLSLKWVDADSAEARSKAGPPGRQLYRAASANGMESSTMRRIIIIGVSAVALAAPAVASAFPAHVVSRNPAHIVSLGFVTLPGRIVGSLPSHIVTTLPSHIVGSLPSHITTTDAAGDPLSFSTVWGSLR
jgi:hypothetical protein